MKELSLSGLVLKTLKRHPWAIAAVPFVLTVGILAQIGVLSKYNALSCFDWGQVPGDTSILFFPLCSFLLGYSSIAFGNTRGQLESLWKLVVTFAIGSIILAAIGFIGYGGVFPTLLFASFLLGGLLYLILAGMEKLHLLPQSDEPIKNLRLSLWFFPSAVFLVVTSVYMVFTSLSLLFFDGIYKTTFELGPKDEKIGQVHYQNGNCIIYGSGLLISPDDKDAKIYIQTNGS